MENVCPNKYPTLLGTKPTDPRTAKPAEPARKPAGTSKAAAPTASVGSVGSRAGSSGTAGIGGMEAGEVVTRELEGLGFLAVVIRPNPRRRHTYDIM